MGKNGGMPVIRPEAKEQLLRWREALAGGVALALGLWWLFGARQLLLLPGVALCLAGGALIWIGIQRARFRVAGQGPGSVQVDEGQITYYGPLTGGAVALADLAAITFDPTLHPAHWRLKQTGVPELLIPVNADGADKLFDAFSTLPGLRIDRVLAALKSQDRHPNVIWQRTAQTAAAISLH
ncbi:MAG: hypothetical protein ABJI43_15935 [Roseobacter sp.]